MDKDMVIVVIASWGGIPTEVDIFNTDEAAFKHVKDLAKLYEVPLDEDGWPINEGENTIHMFDCEEPTD